MGNIMVQKIVGLDPRVQIFSIIGSLMLLGLVLEMIRRKKLKEEYSLLWLFSSMVLLGLSLERPLLHWIARILGIFYPPTALFLIGFGFTLLILLHFSVIVSKLSERTKELAQEIALLRYEIEKNKKNEKFVEDMNNGEKKNFS